jgi:cytochrome b
MLTENKLILSPDRVYGSIRKIDDGLWKWHQYYGYVLTGLLIFRFLLSLQVTGRSSLNFFISPKITVVKRAAFVRLIYFIFYAVLTIIIATGLMLSFSKGWITRQQIHAIGSVHNVCFYVILVFIILHASGLLRAERRFRANIISSMIHGGKNKDADVS